MARKFKSDAQRKAVMSALSNDKVQNVKSNKVKKIKGMPLNAVKKGSIRVWMTSTAGAYGFGRTWTLHMADVTTGKHKEFWLGQDAKVISRAMSQDYRTYTTSVADKVQSSSWDKVMPVVVNDYLDAIINTPDEKTLKKVMGQLEVWSLAVE